MGITQSWEKVETSDGVMQVYLAKPKSELGAGILVIQEIFGVNAHIQDVANRLALEGFTALAPAIFHRTAPGLCLSYSDNDVVQGRRHKEQTTAKGLLDDIQACIKFLNDRKMVSASSFGAIGFCFGGHVAFLAATLAPIKATASFYGAGITTLTPGGGPPSLSRGKDIGGRIEFFLGTEDPLIPNTQGDEIQTELQKHSIDFALHRYPAGHGFFCDKRKDYHKPSAIDAWEKVLKLFEPLGKK